MTIGNNIKKYRKEKKLTQQQLADAIGKSKSIIEKYEADKIENHSFVVLKSIADILDINISDLLDEKFDKEEKNIILGQKIREIRKSKKISSKELGDFVGVSEQAISQYERGLRNIPLENLIKISKALRVTISELTENKYSIYEIEPIECLSDSELIKELLKRGYRVFKEYKEGE